MVRDCNGERHAAIHSITRLLNLRRAGVAWSLTGLTSNARFLDTSMFDSTAGNEPLYKYELQMRDQLLGGGVNMEKRIPRSGRINSCDRDVKSTMGK